MLAKLVEAECLLGGISYDAVMKRLLFVLAACSKGGDSHAVELYQHKSPPLTIKLPGDMQPGAEQPGTFEQQRFTGDNGRVLTLTWAPAGTPGDPIAHADPHELDGGKVIEKGSLMPNGAFSIVDRGGGQVYIRSSIHAGMDSVVCTANVGDLKKDGDVIEACKSMTTH